MPARPGRHRRFRRAKLLRTARGPDAPGPPCPSMHALERRLPTVRSTRPAPRIDAGVRPGARQASGRDRRRSSSRRRRAHPTRDPWARRDRFAEVGSSPRGSQASRRGGRSRPIVIGWPPRLSKGSRARWPRTIVGARVLPAPMRPGRSSRARHPPAVLRLACCADRPRWATTNCRSAATVNTASTAWEGEDTASRTSSRTTATIRPALAAISREST